MQHFRYFAKSSFTPNEVPAGGAPATASYVARALCKHLRDGAVPNNMMNHVLELLQSMLEPPVGADLGSCPETIIPGNEIIDLLATLQRAEASVYPSKKIEVDPAFYLAANKCLKRALLTTQITSAPTA